MIKYLFLLIGFLSINFSFAQTYDIAVKVNGLSCDSELLLANHFADKQYLRDTSECINGVFHFKGNKTLESGVYLVVLPDKNYFEFLVSKDENQNTYYFETDTLLNVKKLITKGSVENELFHNFNVYASDRGYEASKIQAELKETEDETKIKELREKLMAIGGEVGVERSKIAKNFPDLFIGKLYKSMEDIDIAEVPEHMSKEDAQNFRYLWIRDHYWDNVNMSEDGLVRSPVFHNKLKYYVDNYMPPLPDTAIMITDWLINKIETGGSDAQYKYTVQYLVNYFQESKYMCFDKALHHMAKNYYCAGRASWSDTAHINKMCNESAKMEATLCDVVAPDMNMPDTTFRKRIRLSEITTPVTVVILWDIDCGHCKKEMPIIKQYYDSANKEHVEIYAVYTQGNWEGWKKRIRDDDFKFINVGNAFGEDNFRKNYNLRSTPQIYVLDKDKKIKFKKIAAGDIKNTVQYLLEDQGIVEKEVPDTP
jgi:thiol-disulfide isomerase/thioredoxin